MKFYESSDIEFYIDIPNKWDKYCTYPSNKTWGLKPLNRVRSINYYRDYEGAWLPQEMTRKMLYLKNDNWHKNRIVPWACLPLYYANGNRFIKIEKAGPLGFKCTEFPMSLKELRAKIQFLDLEKKRKEYVRWLKKMEAAECKRKSKGKRRVTPPETTKK